MIDLDAVERRITEACGRYEKTAPTVATYLDDLYIRIQEQPASVRLTELRFVSRLVEEEQWLDPSYAANAVLHLLDRLGRDTTGQAGF